MAVQSSDLLVVQTADADPSKLYKLNVGDLDTYLKSDGSDGTVKSVQTTLPLQDDGDIVSPTISIRAASTTQNGSVNRLATSADVAFDKVSPSTTAVVTADLLVTTNATINTLNTDLNSSISDIQTEINAIQLEIDGIQTEIDGIQTDVSGNASAIAALQTDVSGNASAIAALQTDVSGNASAIAALQSDLTTLATTVSTNSAAISALQAGIDGGEYAT